MAGEQDRQPTAEESAGMAWWNALTEGERSNCLSATRYGRSGGGVGRIEA
jgi:hypothetical protein